MDTYTLVRLIGNQATAAGNPLDHEPDQRLEADFGHIRVNFRDNRPFYGCADEATKETWLPPVPSGCGAEQTKGARGSTIE